MRFAADENFDGKVLLGLRQRFPDLDLVRVQDTEMLSAPDPVVLAWAAEQERIILTHDIQTMVGDAYARIAAGLSTPGVILVPERLARGLALSELTLIVGAGNAEDFADQVTFIPLS